MNVKKDQHFLESKNLLLLEKNISNINEDDVIFEIGSGNGKLTEFLLEGNPKKVIGIEIDESMEKYLIKIKNKFQNKFEYKIGNGLEEIGKIKFNKLISNIPYSITEPLYNKIMELKIPFCVIIHGAHFFEMINDENSKWNYYVNSFYNLEKIIDIAGNAFNPPTKTMSVLVKLKLKDENRLSKKDRLIQKLFSKKDRNVKNVFIFSLVDFGKTKKEAKKIFNELDLKKEIEKNKFSNLSNENFLFIIKELLKELNVK